jgi:hypothetical protein
MSTFTLDDLNSLQRSIYEDKKRWVNDRYDYMALEWFKCCNNDPFKVHLSLGSFGKNGLKLSKIKNKNTKLLIAQNENKIKTLTDEIENFKLMENSPDTKYTMENSTQTDVDKEYETKLETELKIMIKKYNDHIIICDPEKLKIDTEHQISEINKNFDDIMKRNIDIIKNLEEKNNEKDILINKYKRKLGRPVTSDIDIVYKIKPIVKDENKVLFVKKLYEIREFHKKMDSSNYLTVYKESSDNILEVIKMLESKTAIMMGSMLIDVIYNYHSTLLACFSKLDYVLKTISGSVDVVKLMSRFK